MTQKRENLSFLVSPIYYARLYSVPYLSMTDQFKTRTLADKMDSLTRYSNKCRGVKLLKQGLKME